MRSQEERAGTAAGDPVVGQEPRFRVLGALEVLSPAGPVPINGALRKRALAMLLLEAGQLVPVSRLVRAVWGHQPPETAAHQIRKTVADLRRRVPGGTGLILTDGPGYRAVVAEDRLDLLRYQRLLRRARQAVRATDRDGATTALRAALALWRGPVLAGEGGPFISTVSTVLEEERLVAAEQLYRLLLERGQSAALVGELRALVGEHPLRETLRGHLMLALYRSGQQAAALEEYARLRALLAEELGIDPSAELAALHERMLRQEPSLTLDGVPPRPAGGAATGGARPDPWTLPYGVPDFAGRAAELDWIRRRAAAGASDVPVILAIDGMGGSGKTALAVHAAHTLAADYRDGCLHVDLRGFTPGQAPLSPYDAQGELLAAAGIPGDEIPNTEAGRGALWRSYMSGRRAILVLDNAHRSEQVRPLVPAGSGSLVLVTSRPRLTGLDGASWCSLGALPDEASRLILRGVLGRERVEREPAAAAELVRLCGGLPLAVRIAAARLSNRPRWELRQLADRLRDHERRLDELTSEGRGVAGTLLVSYQAMPEEQRTAFRLLGLHPGQHVHVAEAAALFGVPDREAEDILEELVDAHLLEPGEPDHYVLHDLVRSFVRRLGQQHGGSEPRRALERLLDHFLVRAEAAGDTLFPGRPRYGPGAREAAPEAAGFTGEDAALRWLDQHRETLLTAVDIADEHGLLRHVAYLPRELGLHSGIRGYDARANQALEKGVAASRELREPALLRLNLTNLAMGHWRLGRLREAVSHLNEALTVCRRTGDVRSQAECRARLGQAYNSLGELPRALRLTEEANQMARRTGFTRLDGTSLSTLSGILVRLGRHEEAVHAAIDALAVFAELGETRLSVDGLGYLAEALVGLGRPEEALTRLRQAEERCDALRLPAPLPLVLARRSVALAAAGRGRAARECALHALAEVTRSTDDIHRATVHLCAGRVYLAGADHPAAVRQFTLTREIAEQMELAYELACALDGLAESSAATGDGAAARRWRAEAGTLFAVMGVPFLAGAAPPGGRPPR
ncbi:BTAD domain-containing putative transcriptional regulator [Streptomyces sp. DSM 44915]|uniref:BTAD domain-containing putative transcriptional regulator n=1 Tax=Streptomyces chisholmiae TaxID=3075540 RepID=A0ABU2JNN4_9ACTN|nr:BTAD domain-containing putative transcriptional regulator [Streptomyces sp. DSM 44915]MDT0266597.1 BTAD domain-containing putative transcriptional regulator [Streptomyces sp. DSM 44915]